MFKGDGMSVPRREGTEWRRKNTTEVADWLFSAGDLWCFMHRVALLFLGADKPVCAAGDQSGDKGQQHWSTKASPWPLLELRAQHPRAAGEQRSHLGESQHPAYRFLG